MLHERIRSQPKSNGPVRTLKVGDRITVYGDLEVVAVEGRCVHGARRQAIGATAGAGDVSRDDMHGDVHV